MDAAAERLRYFLYDILAEAAIFFGPALIFAVRFSTSLPEYWSFGDVNIS
jgi:hypothetical protein